LKGKYRVSSSLLLLAPVLGLLLLIIVVPEIWALFLSFTKYEPGTKPVYVGLRNYIEIIRDRFFIQALLNNVFFVAVVVSLELLVGLGSALLLNHRFPLQRLWVSLLIAPYCVSLVVACVIWRYMLNPSYGVVNYTLSSLGLSPLAWFGTVVPSFLAVIIVDVWKFSPFLMVIAYSALTALPLEVLEASNIDGASGWATFQFITLPLITPALLVGLIFRVIFALRTFGIIWILTQGGPGHGTEVLSIYLYKESFRYFHFGKGSAVAWFMLIITALFSISIVKRMYKRMF